MQPLNVSRLDLNLLKVFDALLSERRVTKAAERLFLSQPALSHALARLREALGDELFTRTPTGMRPTPFALAIAVQIQAALAQIDRALASRSFDPATSSRTFTIGANDYVQFVVLPRLISRLSRVAPGVRLVARGFGDVLPLEPLERGDFDVVIGLFDRIPAALKAETLFSDRFVCLARRSHSALRGGLTLRAYAESRHVLVSPQGGGFQGPIDEELAARGVNRRVMYSIQQFLVATLVVAESELLVTTPERVARLVARLSSLRVTELPLELAGFDVKQVSHARSSEDAGAAWLRAEITRVARRSPSSRN
jgi:DNA-binding transcriptional LysR family regulator